jgi:sugar lactone lactonase YvrE
MNRRAARRSAALAIGLSLVVGTMTSPSHDLRADGTLAVAAPGVVRTLGGAPASAPATQLAMDGFVTVFGNKLYVNRFAPVTKSSGIWAIDLSTGLASRVAGAFNDGFSGDGGPAALAGLNAAGPVAFDGSGRMVIADTDANRVRRIDAAGVITTIAGTGSNGFAGDGGQARSAQLGSPLRVAAASDGTVYIYDSDNSRIRRVTPAGVISTFAGDGTTNPVSGENVAATSVPLGDLGEMATDAAGNLYFSIDGGTRIRRVTPAGQIATVAGNGTTAPEADNVSATSTAINASGIAVAPSGTIYIADTNRIRKVSGGTITVQQVVGAKHLTVAPGGTIFFTRDDGFVRSTDGSTPLVIGGNGNFAQTFSTDGTPVANAEFDSDKSIALLPDGSLVLSEFGNERVRKISISGVVTTIAGGGSVPAATGLQATQVRVQPRGLATDGAGNVYFADSFTDGVYVIAPSGQLKHIAGDINGDSSADPDGTLATTAFLTNVHGLAVDAVGNVFIDSLGTVWKVDLLGTIRRYAGTGDGVGGFDGDGGLARSAHIDDDAELAVDPQGDLYIAGAQTNTVRRVRPNGIIDTYAGGGNPPSGNGDGGPATQAVLDVPENVVVDGVGNLYICEKTGKRIRRVFRTSGLIESIAGDGSRGQAGDGGAALSANFDQPYGLAIDQRGNVFVADGGTGRLRVIGGPSWLGSYVPLTPSRILDTREGIGAPIAKVGPDSSIDLTVLGHGGVPASGVSGVIMNVTATNPTANSFVTVWPAGQPQPLAASLNFVAGQTIPNSVTASIGANGKVSLYNLTGTVDLIADVVGYFTDTTGLGAREISLPPSRILDTREGIGTGGTPHKLTTGDTISLHVLGVGGVPANTGVSAVVLNVTATEPTASSFVTVYPSGQARPTAASLNFVPGQTIPNQVIAKVGAGGNIDLFNFAGNVHLVADVVGYFTQAADPVGAVVNVFSPHRILDTRDGTGTGAVAKVGAGGTISLTVTGVAGVPSTGVTAVVLNITATNPTAGSFLTVYPTGQPQPLAASLNYAAGETIPNQVIAKVGDNGQINLFNFAGTVDYVADIVGYYT